jgi:hypothetical protein
MWGCHENGLSTVDRQALAADAYARSLTEVVTLCREFAASQAPSRIGAKSHDAA